MARVRRVIDEGIAFYEHAIERDDGITLFRGRAHFVDAHTLQCDGDVAEFNHALIATGARPSLPDVPGLDRVPFATSNDLLAATELPGHLVCLGAGAVSLEFAQAYRRLGAEVTVVLRGDRLARGEDAELTALLARYLKEEGVRLRTGVPLDRLELDGGRPSVVLADGGRVTGDRLLVALGRAPVVDGLGLEQAGIAFGPGGVIVDEHLRTSLPHVYAIGDAIGGWMFTHAATYEAPIAIANMLDGANGQPDYRTMPRAIFTDPELAGVGLTEEQAIHEGFEVEVRRFDVGKTGKSRALGDRRGRVKFVLDSETGAILGAHILSRHGADLLPGPAVAMNAPGGTLAPLLATIHAHPTLSEAVKVAARDG
ncbi:MAG: NAD(P)/FAD-dependent oxidoreductase [Actinobacteria bacterium]|nr:NAD(P)/FAD-dependent oxidoreductase [Actinomycetota bacterium]